MKKGETPVIKPSETSDVKSDERSKLTVRKSDGNMNCVMKKSSTK